MTVEYVKVAKGDLRGVASLSQEQRVHTLPSTPLHPMHLYICIYMYIYIYVFIYLYIYVCVCVYAYIYMIYV